MRASDDSGLTDDLNRLVEATEQAASDSALVSPLADRWEAFLGRPDLAPMPDLRADALRHAATIHRLRFEASNDQTAASRAEALLVEALDLRSRSGALRELGAVHASIGALQRTRYERVADDDLRRSAEHHFRLALESYDRRLDAVHWAMVNQNLAGLETRRYELTGDEVAARAAARHFELALTIFDRRATRAEWALTKTNQGALHTMVYERTGESAAYLAAEECYRGALAAQRRRPSATLRATVQHSLGVLRLMRYERTGEGRIAGSARRVLVSALDVFTPDVTPADWAMVQNTLGNLMLARYDRTDDEALAVHAEDHYLAALSVWSEEAAPGQWAMVQHNLASLAVTRYERSADLPAARTAEARFRDALRIDTRAESPMRWATIRYSLGNLFLGMYERTAGEEAAVEAEEHFAEALTVFDRASAPHHWALVQHDVGDVFALRYYHTGDVTAADASERHFAQALEEFDAASAPIQRAMTNFNLGNLALSRYERFARESDAARAAEVLDDALTLYRREGAAAQAATVQHSIGLLALTRFERTGAPEAAAQAERALTGAARAFRRGSPGQWVMAQHGLGLLGLASAERTNDPRRRAAALRAARRRLDAVLRRAAGGVGHSLVAFEAAADLMRVHFNRRNWTDVTAAYGSAANALEDLYRVQLYRASMVSWLGRAQGLAQRAAYAFAKLGRADEAVLALERSRARLMSESLARDRADLAALERVRPELVGQYRDASARLAGLEGERALQTAGIPLRGAIARRIKAAREDLAEAVRSIRRVEGFGQLLAPPLATDVLATPIAAPLVFLAAAPDGGLGLVLREGRVTTIWLPDLTLDALNLRLFGSGTTPSPNSYLGAYAEWRDGGGVDGRARQAWPDALDETTRWLWDAAIGPLSDAQVWADAGTAVLVPTGLLGILPLHAAWTQDSRHPTGRRYALDDVTLVYSPNVRAFAAARALAEACDTDRMLLVVDPQRGGPPLAFAADEAASVSAYWPLESRISRGFGPCRTTRWRAAATVAELTRLLPAHDVFHFAGHAFAQWSGRTQGGLSLADGEVLGLSDWYQLRVRLRLAVLSACESGVPGLRSPDEVLSLPAALAEAGAAGVLGSLWAVTDRSTAILVDAFYRHWREMNLPPAEALRRAQMFLRDQTSYTHPVYWAGFSYTGV